MAIGTRSYARPYLPNEGRLPQGIKWLLIANTAIFVLAFFSRFSAELRDFLILNLALTPAAALQGLKVWQPVTYMFLHFDIWHILFNMLALWMFGCDLEQAFGTRRFIRFYFLCGTGAGLVVIAAGYAFGGTAPLIPTLGASGAIYGILLACAVLWPDRIILFMFLFPLKLKYAAMLYGAIAFLGTFNQGSGVSDVAHLSGMAFAYLFLKMPAVRGFDPVHRASDGYKAWKLSRAKKKFQVYLRKKQSDRGDFVN
jgi:membrane associated rhomboid family serine protease